MSRQHCMTIERRRETFLKDLNTVGYFLKKPIRIECIEVAKALYSKNEDLLQNVEILSCTVSCEELTLFGEGTSEALAVQSFCQQLIDHYKKLLEERNHLELSGVKDLRFLDSVICECPKKEVKESVS